MTLLSETPGDPAMSLIISGLAVPPCYTLLEQKKPPERTTLDGHTHGYMGEGL